MVNPSLREPKQILSRSEEESEEFPKSKKRKDDFMSSDKLAEGPKSSDYGFDYESITTLLAGIFHFLMFHHAQKRKEKLENEFKDVLSDFICLNLECFIMIFECVVVVTVEGEYYVFKDKSNSIKYMTPDDFHYFYGKKTKEEQFEDNYDERDEEFGITKMKKILTTTTFQTGKSKDQPKPIKTKFSDGDFILQAMEETMLKRRSPRGGKGKESEDISTLEELSSDVPKWKSADANDDSEDD
ncbi:hypothetical protein MtrunA17_Chr4g0059481 [Medicago truncatula]|uniref:Uncharacterized protein n=1 Tax=Medicago truncatula TaxID=3880 RepID=A0A396IFG6_MEDTR|nr:hypothetical protein MtrunA17_Chr4g0059481 [Medicago truncatula]